MAASFKERSAELHGSITNFLGTQEFVLLDAQFHVKSKVEEIVLVLMPWRALVVMAKLPLKIQVSFSFLAVQFIQIREAKKIVIETDTSSFEFNFQSSDDLEQAVSHMITSLKKVFPGSSPGDLLQNASPSLLSRIQGVTDSLQEAWKESPCGGFSETYAALCDYSGLSAQEEIQWDVDNIYHARGCREFNLLDFNHLPSQDVALCVASLSFNQWFTKLSCKDFKLNQVILEEILLALRKSVTLKELELENCGLKSDFAQQMALVLQEYPNSALNSLNLSRNLLEDRGIIALSQMFEQRNKGFHSLNFARTCVTQKGMMALCLSFINNGQFRTSLSHLDLSGNPGSLLAEGGNGLFCFLSQPNALGHFNLSGSDCALHMLFDALAGGCCLNLTHLNLCKNVYSHKIRLVPDASRSLDLEDVIIKSRGDPFAIGQFFSQASGLQHVSLSGTKLPPEALRALLQALANNTQLKNLRLDLSSCELRSAGAEVIQDLISDASSICDLNLSDNGFDSDMVTLVLSINRSKSIKHVALGKNFNIQSRETLVDTLHRIVQLTQDEDCSVESISVAESRLKLRTGIILDGLRSSSHLVALDISGNAMGDLGAKILAKALSVNKTLRTLMWDRNNTTLYGFLDVISALERNFILTKMPLPMNDIAVAYRSHPEKMEEIVHQIQSYLARNQIQVNLLKEKGQLQLDSQPSSSEQAVQDACQTVQKYIGRLSCVQDVEVKADLLWAEEAIKDATLFMDILPILYEAGTASYWNGKLQHKLEKLIEDISQTYSKEIQAVVQSQLDVTQSLHPQILQKTGFLEQLFCNASETNVLDQLMTEVYDKVMKIQLSITEAMTNIITEKTLEELTTIQDRLAAAQWRHTCSTSLLPTPSLNGLSELALKVGAGDNEIGSPQSELSLSRASAKSRPASTKDAQPGSGLLPCTEPASAASLMDLPTAGEKLEHYTRDRPRPNRRNRQPPSKTNQPQGHVIKPRAPGNQQPAVAGSSDHVIALCDLPIFAYDQQSQRGKTDSLNDNMFCLTARQEKVQPPVRENTEDRSIARLDEGLDEFFTKKVIHEYLLPSSLETSPTAVASPSSGSRTLKKKIGHFFAFKKPKSSRGAKSEKDPEGSPSPARGRKLMLSDILRTPSKASDSAKTLSKSEEGGLAGENRSYLEQSQTPDSARRARPKYSREGKSQSLILLSGEETEGLGVRHEKKRSFERSDGELPSSFEQRVHVMLHRIGVTKVLSSEGKKKQLRSSSSQAQLWEFISSVLNVKSKDGEIKKAGSDGDIVDCSAESASCALKSRTHSISTDPSVRTGSADAVGRAGVEPSGGSLEGRLSWKVLGKQLNAEFKGKCSELSPLPRRGFASQDPAGPREQKGRESWSSSLPRTGRSTAAPLPLRRISNAGEGRASVELQNSFAHLNTIAGDNQFKSKPRLKPVANRRAMSVHEEQLRDQACTAELHHAKIPLCLQRSPILKWKTKPKLLLESGPSAPSDSLGPPPQEQNVVASNSKPRADTEELPQATEQTLQNAQNTALDQRTALPPSKSPIHEH